MNYQHTIDRQIELNLEAQAPDINRERAKYMRELLLDAIQKVEDDLPSKPLHIYRDFINARPVIQRYRNMQ